MGPLLVSLERISNGLTTVRDDVRAAIGQAAERTGVAFSYLLAQAKSESGLDPGAKAASSSASGLYQFLDQSWLAIVKKHGAEHGMGWAADAISAKSGGGFTVDPAYRQAVMGLREQAGPAALMAGAYAADNAQGLGRVLGRAANATDLYFAHFLGLGGASKFLTAAGSNPDATAASLFPREAGANRSIFYEHDGSARSLGEVYALMGRKLSNAGADDDAVAAGPPTMLASAPQSGVGLQLAALEASDGGEGQANGGGDVAAALAALQHNQINVLRPTPAQAKLAYLMLSAPSV
ncbi:hypothetical protein FHS31_003229 [Sphingomonas vulcanisoli]|uniref:Lytic transglycosylase domain-containing protein n=1 Tax=Sphingomonas vulcanisoli TaxID=1658060 RepID=A0ABX0TVM1_9SPHN|nr:hypothetical protein [Sphingomonas vulcanisoli]NIJ09592.1 hypothetical protein [Sphingomonas vulcanisoli]